MKRRALAREEAAHELGFAEASYQGVTSVMPQLLSQDVGFSPGELHISGFWNSSPSPLWLAPKGVVSK
jgi:hypothetical protein